MQVIVCGAGQVGFQIARRLAEEGNDVTVIDLDAELVARCVETLDVKGVTGHASHPDVLNQADAGNALMLIAATHFDEVNMVACQVAHTIFEVPRKIARVRSQAYLSAQWSDLFRRDHMPIDITISPELEVARVVLRRLGSPSAFDSVSFLDGRVRAVGARVGEECSIANTPLRQLTELFEGLPARIVGISRDGVMRSAAGEDELQQRDEVYFIAEEPYVNRMLGLLGHADEEAERVVVIGGGNIGVQVAQELETSGRRAKLIEYDRARAERAAETLERTIVIHGDGLSSEILAEADVAGAQAVVALTQDDKVNVLAGALAKQLGCPRAIALSNDPSFLPLAAPLGIDAFVDPRATTVSTILRHVRRGRVRALHSLRDGAAEIFEAVVLETSQLAGRRIRDLEMSTGAVIGAVLKGAAVVMPTGALQLEKGDIVVMFSTRRDQKEVERMFSVGFEYF